MTAWLSGWGVDMLASLAHAPEPAALASRSSRRRASRSSRNSLTSAVSLSRRGPRPREARQPREDGVPRGCRLGAAGTAGEADAVWTVIDALVQACLARDLAGKLCDVDAQALGSVQPGVDVPDIGDGIKPASLHRDGLQDARRKVRWQRIAQLIRDHALDGLKPFGCRCR